VRGCSEKTPSQRIPSPRKTKCEQLEFTLAEPLTPEEIEAANALQEGYFDENVDLFEPPLPEGVPEHLAAIVRACRLQPGERMLDVGTGTGILIPYILQYRPSEIHACDLSENMLRRVRRKFPQVIAHHCDVRTLLLPDDSLDAAVINACFSNIVDKARSLDNLYRLLCRKGRLIISHPLGRDFIIELKKHTPLHLDLLPDEGDARRLLEQHGFEIVSFRDEPQYYLLVAVTTKKGGPSAP
jgi:SAM-dependent methyltransferase